MIASQNFSASQTSLFYSVKIKKINSLELVLLERISCPLQATFAQEHLYPIAIQLSD